MEPIELRGLERRRRSQFAKQLSRMRADDVTGGILCNVFDCVELGRGAHEGFVRWPAPKQSHARADPERSVIVLKQADRRAFREAPGSSTSLPALPVESGDSTLSCRPDDA